MYQFFITFQISRYLITQQQLNSKQTHRSNKSSSYRWINRQHFSTELLKQFYIARFDPLSSTTNKWKVKLVIKIFIA